MYKLSYKKCEKCNENFGSSRFKAHLKICNGKPKRKLEFKISDIIIEKDNKIYCKICNNEFKSRNSLGSHYWKLHCESGKKHTRSYKLSQKGREAWNKGLTKETDNRVVKNSEAVSKTIKEKIENGTFIPNRMGEAARKRLSIEQSIRNRGGRCKWYNVSKVSVQGTWERNIALILNDLKIKWKKLSTNRDVFEYTIDNKIKHYTPDFYLEKYNVYLEIKGYWWGNDKEKMRIIFETYPNIKFLLIEKEQYDKILKDNNILLILILES